MKTLFSTVAVWALTAAAGYGQVSPEDFDAIERQRQMLAEGDRLDANGIKLFGTADKSVTERLSGTLPGKIARDYRIGDWGMPSYAFRVLNKVSKTECLVLPLARGSEPMLLRGLDTSKVTTGAEFTLHHPVIIHDTYTYTAVSGTEKTILVLDHNVDKLKEILAKQDAEIEAKRKAVADKAKAEKERKEAAEAAKWRTWTDASGEHKTDAKFVGIIAGKVKLIKRDGSSVQVPLDKLSDEDREWIANRHK
jgi:uncharacterized cupin superfamily protein